MKPVRMKALKRDMNVVSRGLRTSIRILMAWINASPDKDVVKRRLLITLGVPAGFIFMGSQYPVPAMTGALVLSLGTIFWFARVEDQKMTIRETDFGGPYSYAGRVVDFEGLLGAIARAHPSATLTDIAEHIFEAFEGPDLSDDELAAQMRLYGIVHASIPGPSTAEGIVEQSATAAVEELPAEEGPGPKDPEDVKKGDRASWVAHLGSHLKVSLKKVGNRRSATNEETSGEAT